MKYILAMLLTFSAALGGLKCAAQSFPEEMLAQATLTPPFPPDSCIRVYVRPATSKQQLIECDNRSIADVARQLARYYALDSIAFVKPIDTSKYYLGGRFFAFENRMFALFEHLDTFTRRFTMWPQHKTLFVWTYERPAKMRPGKKYPAKKD